MKKTILFLVIASAFFIISGCSSQKCDICDGFGADNVVQAVTTWYLCDDCYDDFLKDDYNSGHSQYNSDNKCLDCGTSIDSGRFYCNKCLGYGTCQDCGKSIDSDRLLCNECLGYGTCQDCGKSIDSDHLYCDECLGYGTCQDCGKSIDSDKLFCNECLFY